MLKIIFFLLIAAASNAQVQKQKLTFKIRKTQEVIISDTIKKPEKKIIKESKPHSFDDTIIGNFIIVEQMPEYPGGEQAMMAFISNNSKYPITTKIKELTEIVYLTFIVELDGSLSNITILKSESPELAKEAIRLVSIMPRWEPGKQAGRATRVQVNLPINFRKQKK